MNTVLQVLAVLIFLVLFISFVFKARKQEKETVPLTDNFLQLLIEHVVFYRQLDAEGKKLFGQKLQHFMNNVRITGVNTEVEELDKVLIGAGAVIPIYAFPEWEYVNLHEVLLYPDAFSREFEQSGAHRSITGMVGNGPMQNVMILSRQALRQGFMDREGKSNAAIHEFVHLIDKTDGSVDGVPEILLSHQYVLPWLKMIRETMQAMQTGTSDIDLYGLTNPAEFFAVVSEYFFKRPELLQQHHPQLYAMLERMFLKKEEVP